MHEARVHDDSYDDEWPARRGYKPRAGYSRLSFNQISMSTCFADFSVHLHRHILLPILSLAIPRLKVVTSYLNPQVLVDFVCPTHSRQTRKGFISLPNVSVNVPPEMRDSRELSLVHILDPWHRLQAALTSTLQQTFHHQHCYDVYRSSFAARGISSRERHTEQRSR
jgi:hypothetical protein